MKRDIVQTGLAFVLAAMAGQPVVVAAPAFTLTSSAFKNNAAIPDKFAADVMGCTGQNVSPALEWKNAPAGTKSFVLMERDPDAPTGSGWWHWVVYNLPADTASLAEGAGATAGTLLPKGTLQGNTDIGKPGYGGACPPPGASKHHYDFTLFALKIDKLEVPPGASAAMIGYMANANALGKAKLTGTYARPK
jgi:Raf kinase inhibitor-like YbhB/YbcL family protein